MYALLLVLTALSPSLFPLSMRACSLLTAFCLARMLRMEYSLSGSFSSLTAEISNQSQWTMCCFFPRARASLTVFISPVSFH